MKKYVMLALATVLMFSATLNAQIQSQQNNGKDGRRDFKQSEKKMISPEQKAEYMAKQLNLSNAEKVKVLALIEKQAAAREIQQGEMKKVREEQKAKREVNRKAQEADLIKIIGNEKFQQLQAMQIEHLKKMNRSDRMKNRQKKHMNNGQERPMRQVDDQNS